MGRTSRECACVVLSRALMNGTRAAIIWAAGAGPVAAEERTMAWKTPKIVEVSLALEINGYACAEID